MTKRSTKNQRPLPDVDILILHGQSIDLVNYLISLLKSINITANNVLNLPSGKMDQERKVEYYLRDCGLPLVLVTFDEEDPTSNKARPNVYDELARCRSLRRKDILVLQERRKSTLVELPSNPVGLVIIQFERDRFYLAIPQLLNEIHSRGFISPKRPSETTLEAGSTLNDFMDEMDKLWDKQFDIAWKKINWRDYAAERNFAETLDKYFQQYHLVVDALVREHKRGDELKAVCDSAYREAVTLAVRAWEYVADAKLKKADEMIDTTNRSVSALKCQDLYEKAAEQLRSAKRQMNPTDKMIHFAYAIDLVDEFLKKLRKQ